MTNNFNTPFERHLLRLLVDFTEGNRPRREDLEERSCLCAVDRSNLIEGRYRAELLTRIGNHLVRFWAADIHFDGSEWSWEHREQPNFAGRKVVVFQLVRYADLNKYTVPFSFAQALGNWCERSERRAEA